MGFRTVRGVGSATSQRQRSLPYLESHNRCTASALTARFAPSPKVVEKFGAFVLAQCHTLRALRR